MRTMRRVGVALLIALALATPAFPQSADDRISLNASVGPSFANLGTTFSTTADVTFTLNDRTDLVGELGVLPRAPFRKASDLVAPLPIDGTQSPRVNAYHWNGNVKVRPFDVGRITPYITGGVGSFTADTVSGRRSDGLTTIEDRRRATDFATNLGAGLTYRVNDWLGLSADYRTFFVHRDDDTPRVNRLTAGMTVSLK